MKRIAPRANAIAAACCQAAAIEVLQIGQLALFACINDRQQAAEAAAQGWQAWPGKHPLRAVVGTPARGRWVAGSLPAALDSPAA